MNMKVCFFSHLKFPKNKINFSFLFFFTCNFFQFGPSFDRNMIELFYFHIHLPITEQMNFSFAKVKKKKKWGLGYLEW